MKTAIVQGINTMVLHYGSAVCSWITGGHDVLRLRTCTQLGDIFGPRAARIDGAAVVPLAGWCVRALTRGGWRNRTRKLQMNSPGRCWSIARRDVRRQHRGNFTLDIYSPMRHCGWCRLVIDVASQQTVRARSEQCSLVVLTESWSARSQVPVTWWMADGVLKGYGPREYTEGHRGG